MADWNPDSTTVKGVQWFPYRESAVVIDSASKAACLVMRQTSSQAIDTVAVRLGAIPIRGGVFVLEVFDGETPVNALLSTLDVPIAQPNEDVSGTGTSDGQWREDDDTTTTIYTEIDETTVNDADYIYTVVPADGTTSTYRGRFNTAGLSLTGKKILGVTLRVRTIESTSSSGGFSGGSIGYGLNISSADYGPGSSSALDAEPATTGWHEFTWYYNPSTKLPWKIADVQALDSTDEFYLTAYGIQGATVRVSMVELVVFHEAENRIAVGGLDDSGVSSFSGGVTAGTGLTPDAWNTITVTTPTGGVWTKDGAGYHTFLLRRLSAVGAMEVVTLDSGAAPNPAYALPDVTLDSPYGRATAAGDAGTALIALAPHTTVGPADSVDGQPYADLIPATVKNGQDAEQEFSNAAAVNYSQVIFLAQPKSATQPLTVRIKRRSDNTQFGGTATIPVSLATTGNVAKVEHLGDWYRITVNLPSVATLAAATQYYIEFQSTSTGTGDDLWYVAAGDNEATGEVASFGGTTDRAVVDTVESDNYDLFAVLLVPPSAPGSFAVATSTQSINSSSCGISTIQRVTLSWSATALSADFVRYVIQQTDDAGATWYTIRYITTESVVSTVVYDILRGVPTSWRIRVERDDGAVSAWSSPVTATLGTAALGAALLFVSDYDPTVNCAYDYTPDINYEFLDAAEAVQVPIYGADYQLGFLPTESRGVRASYVLPLSMGTRTAPGGGTGLAAYAPLRTLAIAAIPYVTILDRYGGRLRAQLQVPSATHSNPGERHVVQLIATEVTGDAYIVTVA